MRVTLDPRTGERTYGVLPISPHLRPAPTNAPRCLLLYRRDVPLLRGNFRSYTHEYLDIPDALLAPIAGEA